MINSFFNIRGVNYIFPLILLIFLIITNCMPLRFVLGNTMNIDAWNVILYKSKHIFYNLDAYGSESHIAKTVFRLTIPLIVKLFHFNYLEFIFLQLFLAYFFIYYLFNFFDKKYASKNISALLTISICTIYFGKALIVDFRWFDGWAFLFIIITLYTRFLLLAFVFLILGFFTDERVIFSVPILIILTSNQFHLESFNYRSLISKKNVTIVLSLIFYILLRIILTYKYDMHIPSNAIGYEVFLDNINKRLIGMGYFTFFEGLWLFPFFYFLEYLKRRKIDFYTSFFIFYFILNTIAVFFIYDVTRSGAYLILFIFFFIDRCYISYTIEQFKMILISSFLICVFFPGYYTLNGIGMNNNFLNEYGYLLLKKISIN
jgi:hypothetical protein